MHHGAEGRLYFLKTSGDPDDKERTSVWVTSRLSPYVCHYDAVCESLCLSKRSVGGAIVHKDFLGYCKNPGF